jgi:hypothetical protein
MAIIKINQNEQRYTKAIQSWEVSASPEIEPIKLLEGVTFKTIVPVLTANNIIVDYNNYYLISKDTFDTVLQSDNPHFSYLQNGSVIGADIGLTIPIVQISLSQSISLALGEEITRIISGSTSGSKTTTTERIPGRVDIYNKSSIKRVYWLWEGKSIEVENKDVPVALVNHLNWMLTENTGSTKPTDIFEWWNLKFNGDYILTDITQKITWNLYSGSIITDVQRMSTYLDLITTKLTGLQNDKVAIWNMFYNGVSPQGKITNPISSSLFFESVATERSIPQLIPQRDARIVNISLNGVTPTANATTIQGTTAYLSQSINNLQSTADKNAQEIAQLQLAASNTGSGT